MKENNKQIRVIYEVECFSRTGEFLGRRYCRTKRQAVQIVNIWKRYGCDASLRMLRKSEWAWVNLADIEREEK